MDYTELTAFLWWIMKALGIVVLFVFLPLLVSLMHTVQHEAESSIRDEIRRKASE